ncbi:hypothetical protein [Anaerobacillus alkalilacustris]|nr:hypothetical protein [Anaerobacillus alkalilacustris]
MGKASKKKGYRGEAEFAKLTNGKRVPLSGSVNEFKNDVILPNGWSVEVKRHKNGLKTLYDWIEKKESVQKPDLVAFRADFKPWIICMTLEKFQQLLNKK